jgi:hypothetical protein
MMDTDYENRHFMIFATHELFKIDFSQVLETSVDTVRKSVDESKTFVKWETPGIPSSVQSLTTKEGPYDYDEMIVILASLEWSIPYENIPYENIGV